MLLIYKVYKVYKVRNRPYRPYYITLATIPRHIARLGLT